MSAMRESCFSSTHSGMALLSSLSGGIALWPVFVYTVDPCPEKSGLDLAFFYYHGLMMVITAVVMGWLAARRIRRSQGTLKGLGLARLGMTLGIFSLFFIIFKPSILPAERRGPIPMMWELHEAEQKYRVLYPDVGYSPDLISLGPPAAAASQSAERAGLVDAGEADGVYGRCKPIRLRYGPRLGPDGKIVGYTLWMEQEGFIIVIDERGERRQYKRKPTGEIRPKSQGNDGG